MTDILEYSFVSWLQFLLVLAVGIIILIIVDRFHLFKKYSWQTSIGYHLFVCLVISIIAIVFLAVSPVIHLVLLLIVFGFVYKNIFAYVRSIFNLYFSKIHIGDNIKIGNNSGILTNINLGGMHISSNNEKAFYPFDNWRDEKIVLLSQAGKVAVSLNIVDEENRNDYESFYAIEKCLFNFPFLANEKIKINSKDDKLLLRALVSKSNMQESLKSNIQKAGFSTNEKNNK